MLENEDKRVPVPGGNHQIVYSIPAKPKKPEPFWKKYFLELMVIGGCFIMMVVISLEG